MATFVPTRSAIDSMTELDLTWADLINDLKDVESLTPVRGYDTRQRWCGRTLQAYVEPGRLYDEDVLYVVHVRERVRAEEPSEHQVVGVATAAQRSTRRGGRGSRWPATWAELLERLQTHEGIRIQRGGKHLVVLRHSKRIFTLPISASDHRAVRNACTQLRALGLDLSR